jgi:hypothetical protein
MSNFVSVMQVQLELDPTQCPCLALGRIFDRISVQVILITVVMIN